MPTARPAFQVGLALVSLCLLAAGFGCSSPVVGISDVRDETTQDVELDGSEGELDLPDGLDSDTDAGLDTDELDAPLPDVGCAPPRVACGGVCVDTTLDASHCGGCFNACPSGRLCVASSCWAESCVTTGCVGLQYCDPTLGVCQPGCERDEQCSGAQHCELASHTCVDDPATPANRSGIGLVGPGNPQQWDWAADLAGPGGHIKLIFPGVKRDTAGPEADWVAAVQGAYDRNLVPVIRMGPPWGERDVRYQSDDGDHRQYTQLAAAYRRVVEALPKRDGWPLWIEVHNEPNLCYEWVCHGDVAGGWIGYQQTAAEYASMLRDVADALHAIGDPRIKVANGGLAPGGAVSCQCDGEGFQAGVTSQDFLREMNLAVPGIFERLDGLASHSYPAEGEGWGFFVAYDRAGPGLRYFEKELAVVGRALPVLMTETGWTTNGEGSRDDHANWTRQAYENLWLVDSRILAIMPFQLQDPGWEAFAWVSGGGEPYPVYTTVRSLRCQSIAGRCP